jgi:hypothetical protein
MAREVALADLVGATEAQAFLGVAKSTFQNWRRRNILPKPVKELEMGPLWTKAQLREWKKTPRAKQLLTRG